MHTRFFHNYCKLYDNDSMKCRFGWRLYGSVAWPWSIESGRADRDQVQVRGGGIGELKNVVYGRIDRWIERLTDG